MSLKKTVGIKGMTCAACANIIESQLSKIDHVEQVNVSFATEQATIQSDLEMSDAQINEHLNKLGYSIRPIGSASREDLSFLNQHKLILALFVSLFLMIFHMSPLGHYIGHKSNQWVQMILASVVMAFSGRTFIKGFWQFLLTGKSTMNTLVGLGIISAYIHGFIVILSNSNDPIYFEAAAMIVALILFGKWLEEKAKRNVNSELQALMDISASTAMLFNQENELIEVDARSIEVGQKVQVRTGERASVDGTIVKGQVLVDSSAINGEAMPTSLKEGDQLLAGMLVLEGIAVSVATKDGKSSELQKALDIILSSQSSRPKIQVLCDQISNVFVPIVIVISSLTFIYWFFVSDIGSLSLAVNNAISVLVIACPCALGLATPTAVMVGSSVLAQRGLWCTDTSAMERAEKITDVVFDKTGTLSQGKPQVSIYKKLANNHSTDAMAYSMASFSNHPLSISIAKSFTQSKLSFLDLESFEEISGKGIIATYEGEKWYLGSLKFMQDNGFDISMVPDSESTIVAIASKNVIEGLFTIEDPIKENAKELISYLHSKGKTLHLVSGDRQIVVDRFADRLNISHRSGDVLPTDKARYIQDLEKKGKKVLMIGDGLNDAAAMSQATLSMAMDEGIDAAKAVGHVIIKGADLHRIVLFFEMAKKIMSGIRSNLFLSFIFNVVGIPLAAGLFYHWLKFFLPPNYASIAMGSSSLSVLLNALRLKHSLKQIH
ncbi:MAG: copper-translocating P-type ATPase [Bdellovibrio sp. CG12_big_fil_rev_8_21_14_0_65_39_13]|nr:MAG: copper-translocating P-type ATPase [Bdellovibrio sp. CG22_combo_CG10-13_8_21_14_all_39_27]PIQ57618.1 MAG: copper-translocating P-type ATPase [Bdellovibrio sp. CG12_big_fil_rev_8_21_14_0_65_39_13]PIR35782.1 MAG: copper-translocating P-type ATPase [Bdellovibrio sp. CG11_big_fil_rev_8_21_14_0_20_39_38]